jgi:hypothetical protein
LLGFEIADLQHAQDLLGNAVAPLGEGTFLIRQGKILGTLEIVEVRQGRPYKATLSASERTVRFLSLARIGQQGWKQAKLAI